MVDSDSFLTDVNARIEAKRRAKASNTPTMPPVRLSPLHLAASVLSWFDSNSIRGLGQERKPTKEELDELLAMSVPVTIEAGKKRWALAADRRIVGLRDLREAGQLDAALNVNARPSDGLQRVLDAALSGTLPPIDKQGLEQAVMVHMAVGWLSAAGFQNLPDQGEVSARVEWLTLLEPFRRLAEHFRGRSLELAKLRSFVGVLPPRSLRETATRAITSVFSSSHRDPLLVYGPGGVGKSTLVARFILEHAEAIETDRFPFAYLDLDRPEIAIEEPLTLLAEAVRQLGVQYTYAKDTCETIRAGWLERLGRMAETRPGATEKAKRLADIRKAAVEDFARVLNGLQVRDKPMVVVIDTFEEAQYHGEPVVLEILRLVRAVAIRVPRLRVIIAGRAEFHEDGLESLELGAFDEDAALGYLEHRGIRDEELGRAIFRQVGGSPMTLKLAADLVDREELRGGKFAIDTRDKFFRKLDADHVQRQLYTRVLLHIHDVKVRKLAHPGLVLRRITPELIRSVLAEPCEVVLEPREENRLFDELQREVSLVRVDPDGALRHRQDLRMLMLHVLREDKPEKAAEIHRRAVEFYSSGDRDSSLERAEEVYHRLWLFADLSEVDRRWRLDIRPHLYNAVQEFEGAERAFLAARLGVEVDDKVLSLARLVDWERIVERRARGLVKAGKAPEALKVLASRPERTPSSALHAVEARALARVGRHADAVNLVERAIEASADGHSRSHTVRLALLAAELVLAAELLQWAHQAGARLETLELGQMGRVDRVESVAKRALLAELAGSDPAKFEALLQEATDAVSPATLARRPNALYLAAAVRGPKQVRRLLFAFEWAGCPPVSDGALRALAAPLATFDALVSQRSKVPPGRVAASVGVPIRGSLTESWSEFLVGSSKSAVGKTLAAVLANQRVSLMPALVEKLGQLLRDGAGIAPVREADVDPEESTVPSVPDKRSRGQRSAIVEALREAFPVQGELRAFLAERLNRSLDAIAFETPGQTDPLVDLVEAASREGWLALLLARAREARPKDSQLAQVASEAGLAGIAGSADAVMQLQRLFGDSGTGLPPVQWRERLAQIEAQVCMLEIDGQPRGTGFLIGVDLVLTTDFNVFPELASGPGDRLRFRFDYTFDIHGQTITRGVTYRPARDWLLTHAPLAGEHGYALLRVEGSPGAQPIGDSSSESRAQLRRWIEVSEKPPILVAGGAVLLLHHSMGGPLRLSTGRILSWHDSLFHHDAATEPGSSGGPCFDEAFALVGLHSGAQFEGPGRKFGIPMRAIVADLSRKGLDREVQRRFR